MGRNYNDIVGQNNPNYRTGFLVKSDAIARDRMGIYNSWQNMKGRCLRKSHPKYSRYGARGISVCNDWLSIGKFYEWALANGWEKGMTLDRIDNDGNYEPSNCRWISISENSRKKRTTKITFEQAAYIRARVSNGENMHDLAAEYGVVHGTIWFIVKNFTHVAEGKCSEALRVRDEKNRHEAT